MKKIPLVLLFVILTIFARPYFEAYTHLSKATSASNDRAVDLYNEAASWRSPFNSFAATASKQLLALCDSTIEMNIQIACYESLHSALSRSRSAFFLLPFTWGGVTERAAQERLEKIRGISPIQEQFPPTINFKVQLFTQLLFWSWLSLILVSIWRGFDASGNRTFLFTERRFYVAASAFSACFIGWLALLTF